MLEIFTTVVGSLMGLSFLPQAWKIFQLKRSEEISLFTVGFILFGASVWVFYGVIYKDPVIIVANICGIIGSGTTLAAALYYRRPHVRK